MMPHLGLFFRVTVLASLPCGVWAGSQALPEDRQTLSAGAIVARVKQVDRRTQDLQAAVLMEIERDGAKKTRRFQIYLRREGSRYEALVEVQEPVEMSGVKFLIHADRGKRNQQWTYFPDLDLVRKIPGSRQEDPFLGSDLTYSDLAGGAHLDDMKHELLGEETVAGTPCYRMRGVPRHEIAYGRLEGWISQADFVTLKADFFDKNLELLKSAQVSDFRSLDDEIMFGHSILVDHSKNDSRTRLTFEEVQLNRQLPPDMFDPSRLAP